MADGVFNISKGRGWELADRVEQGDPAASRLVVKLLTTTGLEADATLEDYDTFSAIVTAANTEADFTNYGSGKVITAAGITLTTDDTGNTNYFTIADQTWTAAGGGTNNTLAKLIVCYDPLGTNVAANLVPISHHDFSATTNGNDLTADFGTNVFEAA